MSLQPLLGLGVFILIKIEEDRFSKYPPVKPGALVIASPSKGL